jgi:tungstate transport system ATP-binding protein
MSALLVIDKLRKRFGERELFYLQKFTLDAASAYVLTGVNGAGKSTLLRVLAGLEHAEAASLLFEGKALALDPYPAAMRAAVAYVHQHPIMFSTSVAHLQESVPASLSGGEKQRVALARAKVLRPKLLLLDEPTANLDGAAREQVIALIPTLIAEGSSVVMACHDPDLIGLPGVRRLKLRDGHIEYR